MCAWFENGVEPALSDLLDEPIVAALMERDHVDRNWLENLLIDLARMGTGDQYA